MGKLEDVFGQISGHIAQFLNVDLLGMVKYNPEFVLAFKNGQTDRHIPGKAQAGKLGFGNRRFNLGGRYRFFVF